MAPSRPIHRRTKIHRTKNGSRQQSKPPELTLTQLIDEATRFLHTGNPSAALPLALRVLNSSKSISASLSVSLSALNLLAEIHLELGDADTARSYFLQAVNLDPEGEVPEDEGGGAEKFLWLAQLCEEGGEESVRWFERGAAVLRRDIATEENKDKGTEKVEEKKKKLAGVLCGIIEVYMTDLSFEPSAETQCTTLIASALALAPSSPTPHQTHASILISQSNFPAACIELRTSLSLWQHLPASHPDVLDFPSRISLARLLLEVGMEDESLGVLGGVVEGDEACVEGWYLGGWGLWLMSEKEEDEQYNYTDGQGENRQEGARDEERQRTRADHLRDSRAWLKTCLLLAEQQDYEDDRLRAHAQELIVEIEAKLEAEGMGFEDDEEEWEGVDGGSEDGDEETEKKEGNGSANGRPEDEDMVGA